MFPRLTEFAFEPVNKGLELALWELIRSYSSPSQRTLCSYTPFYRVPAKYVLDIVAVMVRTILAKQGRKADCSHARDTVFVEQLLADAPSESASWKRPWRSTPDPRHRSNAGRSGKG